VHLHCARAWTPVSLLLGCTQPDLTLSSSCLAASASRIALVCLPILDPAWPFSCVFLSATRLCNSPRASAWRPRHNNPRKRLSTCSPCEPPSRIGALPTTTHCSHWQEEFPSHPPPTGRSLMTTWKASMSKSLPFRSCHLAAPLRTSLHRDRRVWSPPPVAWRGCQIHNPTSQRCEMPNLPAPTMAECSTPSYPSSPPAISTRGQTVRLPTTSLKNGPLALRTPNYGPWGIS
jgi:hypothetical protein